MAICTKLSGPRWDGKTVRAKPICLAGERACPPEDCGSYPDHEELLVALDAASPDKDQKHLLEWLDDMYGDYDPEYVDLEAINRSFSRQG